MMCPQVPSTPAPFFTDQPGGVATGVSCRFLRRKLQKLDELFIDHRPSTIIIIVVVVVDVVIIIIIMVFIPYVFFPICLFETPF
jgi:hypothetical protein